MERPAPIKILNRETHGQPSGAVYMGRPSKFGNPYVIGRDGDRDTVISKYLGWLLDRVEDKEFCKALEATRGRDKVCWCAPRRCHIEVICTWLGEDFEYAE